MPVSHAVMADESVGSAGFFEAEKPDGLVGVLVDSAGSGH